MAEFVRRGIRAMVQPRHDRMAHRAKLDKLDKLAKLAKLAKSGPRVQPAERDWSAAAGKVQRMSDLSRSKPGRLRQPRDASRSLASALCLWPAMALTGLLGLAGCATVKPYERGRLAQPDMTEEWTTKARAGQDHATAYREGATGAAGSTGAGCGCN